MPARLPPDCYTYHAGSGNEPLKRGGGQYADAQTGQSAHPSVVESGGDLQAI
jgi:hypothetical protein